MYQTLNVNNFYVYSNYLWKKVKTLFAVILAYKSDCFLHFI